MNQPLSHSDLPDAGEPTRYDDFMTVTHVAEATALTYSVIISWIKRGILPATRSGRRYLVRRADLAVAQQRAYFGTVIPNWRANPRHSGQRLRALREARGWDQGQLSSASGIAHETISRLEHGVATPHSVTVRALAEALDVEPGLFISRESLGLSVITAAEAAKQLGVPTLRLLKWLRQGELAGTKVGGRWRILAVTVREFDRSGRLRGQSRRLDPRYRG